MIKVLSKDELKELKELSDRVPPGQYVDMVVKVLTRMRREGFITSGLYTGMDLLMMAGRSLLKELRRTV